MKHQARTLNSCGLATKAENRMTSTNIAGGDDIAPQTDPLAPWPFEAVMELMRQDAAERERSWREGYAHGDHDGYERGFRAAEEEMAAHFALVSRSVRQRAGHPSYAERAAAEREWVKPRPGDYTGRLTEAEYFGMGRVA